MSGEGAAGRMTSGRKPSGKTEKGGRDGEVSALAHDLFGDRVLPVLGKAMDAYSLRHRVMADNIANANTPGFKRSYVPFESELRELVEEGDA